MNCTKNISRGCCFNRSEEGEAMAENVKGCHKMEIYDWLEDTPNPQINNKLFEVQFKNTRKGYYENSNNLEINSGDIVIVESSPGLDVGIITLTGDLVAKQMQKNRFNTQDLEFKKIVRIAKAYDIEKWQEAISLEHNTMIRSRQIASDLGLKMKIGDVEYQGDRLKAIFYYIADDRVDFRELIKILAEQFRVRIEMKQIGARQEAGRIGGISACGRELCCSTWQNSFQSVTIGSARHQEISLNPQKLAGQCGKLKCCLNYEVDNYIDARKDFPRLNAPLEALDGSYHLVKTDIFKKIMWFSPDPMSTSIMIPLSIDRVRKIMALNRKGTKVDKFEDESLQKTVVEEPQYLNVVGEESITRFDKSSSGSRRNNKNRTRSNSNGNGEPQNNAADQKASENESQNENKNFSNQSGNRRNRNSNNNETQNGNNEQRTQRFDKSSNEGAPQTNPNEKNRDNSSRNNRGNSPKNSSDGENRKEGKENNRNNGGENRRTSSNNPREGGDRRGNNNTRDGENRRADGNRPEGEERKAGGGRNEKADNRNIGSETPKEVNETRKEGARNNNRPRFRNRNPKPQE